MTSPPSILTNGQTNSGGANPSISNSAGALLFYSDGTNIRNSAHAIMANGSGLNAGGVQDVIVKRPGSQNIYEIFMLGFGFGTLYYSEIDMSLAAGMGSVTVRNVPLGSFLSSQLSAVKACNGIDVWVAVHGTSSSNPNNFYAFLVTSSGVNGFPVISATGPNVVFSPLNATTMKFSPNGTKLGFGTLGQVTVFDFDAATGIFSNPFSLQATLPVWSSLEFSPDGSKLYSKSTNDLRQWDLCAGNSTLVLSSVITFTSPNNLNLTSLQLAKNGKIYVGQGSQTFLGVINNPNVAGSGCNYVPNALSLLPGICGTLPNFVTSYFKAPPPPFSYSAGGIYGCQAVSFTAPPVTTSTCTSPGYSLTGMQWNFSDPLSGPANTSTLSNPTHVFTSVGTHTVQVVLYYSCGGGTDTLRQAVNVVQPCLTVNNTSITCATLGSATVQTNSGTGPYTFTWMPGAQTGSVATGLNPGIYTISVFDAGNNMTYTASTVFTSPVPLTANLNSSSVSCYGASTGTANYSNFAGGSGNQTYVWTNGLQISAAPNPTNLSAGTWSSTVTDALTGCVVNNTFVITQPPALTLSIVANTPTNCVATNMLLSGNSSGGTPGYTYSWAAGPVTNTLMVNFSAGTSQTYTLTSFDANACPISNTITISFVPIAAASSNGPRCNGDNLLLSGSGVPMAIGAYNWSGPSGYNSAIQNPTINIVSLNNAGVYDLMVTAVNGCAASASTTVVVNPTPTLTVVGSTVCSNQTMSLSANSFAGAAYAWSGPLGFNSSVQNIAVSSPSVTQSGIYSLTVTSVPGCTNTGTAAVSIVPPPNTLATLSSPSLCAQALSGSPNSIILTGSGASTYTLLTPNHIYNPNPGGPASPLNLLPPYNPTGPATATLIGSNGVCTAITTASFLIIPNPTVSVASPTPVICAGQSFTYTSAGANSYSWSAATPGNTLYTTGSVAVANPSINSVFSVVGGSLGCNSAIQNLILTVNTLPQLSVTPASVCKNSSVVLKALGTGTSFTWSPSSFLNSVNSQSVISNPPTLQNYQVTSSLNNCTMSAMVTVSVLTLPTASITALQTVFCQNEKILLSGSGGTEFQWSGPSGYTGYGQTLQLAAMSNAFNGSYTLTVSDQNNCKGSSTQFITVNSLPQGYLSSVNTDGCAPVCTTLQLKQASGSAALSEIDWQLGNLRFNGDQFYYCFNSPGDYPITGKLKDINNCVNTVTSQVTVYPKPKADFDFTPQQPVENLEEVKFSGLSKDAVACNWNFGTVNFHSTQQDPKYVFENSGYYPIALIVRNKWQCSDTLIKTIYVEPDFAVYIPDAFTPNDDNLNELFIPVLRGDKNFTLSIFDRWGTKIYETTDITKGWDGRYKGELCQQGVYVWKLNVRSAGMDISKTGKLEKNLTGSVTLYR